MTDERLEKPGEHGTSRPEDSDDILATLLTLPGPRANIDKTMKDRVYQNVHKEWRRSTVTRRRYRWALPAAIAAGILVAMIVRQPAPVLDARPVGSIVRVATAGNLYEVGHVVRSGDVLDTLGGGGLSLMLNGVTSLRLDGDSLLTVDAKDEFTLISGQLYVDTGPAAYGKKSLTVHTASGSAVDIGTQFSVAIKGADMSVAVREGQVDVSSSHKMHNVMAGDMLTVRPGTPASRQPVARAGDSWDWAVSLAPAFDAEGRSLLDFLKWASRESGLELRFASEDLRMAAMQIRQYVPTAGLTIQDAIESVFATNDFSYSIDGHTLMVTR